MTIESKDSKVEKKQEADGAAKKLETIKSEDVKSADLKDIKTPETKTSDPEKTKQEDVLKKLDVVIDTSMLSSKSDFIRNDKEMQLLLADLMVQVAKNIKSPEAMQSLYAKMNISLSVEESQTLYKFMTTGDLGMEGTTKAEIKIIQSLLAKSSKELEEIMAANGGIDGYLGLNTSKAIKVFAEWLERIAPAEAKSVLPIYVDQIEKNLEDKKAVAQCAEVLKPEMYKISFDQRKLNVWNIANINAGLTSRFMVPDQKLPDQKPSINRVNSDYARSTNEVMENYKKAFIEAGIGFGASNEDASSILNRASTFVKLNFDKLIKATKDIGPNEVFKDSIDKMIKEATSKPSNPEALQTFVDDYIVDAGFKQGDTAELVLTANKSANVVKIRVERDGDIIKTFVNDKEACSRNVKSNVNISIGTTKGYNGSSYSNGGSIDQRGGDYIVKNETMRGFNANIGFEKLIAKNAYAFINGYGSYARERELLNPEFNKNGNDVGGGRLSTGVRGTVGNFDLSAATFADYLNNKFDPKKSFDFGGAGRVNYNVNRNTSVGGEVSYSKNTGLTGEANFTKKIDDDILSKITAGVTYGRGQTTGAMDHYEYNKGPGVKVGMEFKESGATIDLKANKKGGNITINVPIGPNGK